MTEERIPYLEELPTGNGGALIREEGNGLRKYFTEIPNIILDMDLDIFSFRLYVHLKRVAGAEGECYQSTATLAKRCGMSKPKISQAKKILAAANLIRIEARDREKGQTDIITIVDIWQENFANYSRSKRAEGGVHHVEGGVHHVVREEEPTIKKEPNTKKELAETPPSSSTRSARGKKKGEATPKPSDHPANQAFRDTFRRNPTTGQMQAIVEANPPIADWIRAIREWNLRGYKPTNVKGMLEWAENPSLMERFSGNTTKRETIRNREEDSNGEDRYTGGWEPEDLVALKAAQAVGDRELCDRIVKESGERFRAKLSQVRGRGLDGR